MATSVTSLCTALVLLSALPDPNVLEAQELPPPAYQVAAAQARVPSALLFAVALQESGKTFKGRQVPWPWTLNVAGQPRRYATRREACTALCQTLQTTPATRVDVGLAQLNVGHQQHRVRRPCDLLDPPRNLRIAATILREQYRPDESWLMAAGRYHRPAGGPPALRYRHNVGRYLNRIIATAQGDPQ
ncbi:transglycosylase SLT domain-containing protein [Pseudomonas asplenii]|uniref:transglycosylase SLT domain-containing protein n=1 Tax=Pseudomonas asplenii TaxID=53407 RepID=UPI0037C70653